MFSLRIDILTEVDYNQRILTVSLRKTEERVNELKRSIVWSLTTLCILLALNGCTEPKCANNSYNSCLNDANPECDAGLCDECCRKSKEKNYMYDIDFGSDLSIPVCTVDH